MTAVWASDAAGSWKLLAPAGFPSEADLHSLVEQSPQLLPLSGSPRLAVVGREVRLGSGYADLIAVEQSGRIAVIEVKLAGNAEARRAVVSQVLAYAAYLHGMEAGEFEQQVMGSHLAKREFSSLFSSIDDGTLDRATFEASVAESLITGRFRVVIVLDQAPDELVQLVGFLEAISDALVIDLITVAKYDVGGSHVVVPQRIEPAKRPAARSTMPTDRASTAGSPVPGAQDFRDVLSTAPPDQEAFLTRLTDWAVELERKGFAKVFTYHGKKRMTTLLPYIPGDSTLVTIFRDAKTSYLALYRSVFERRAPRALERLEDMLGHDAIKQGSTVRQVSDELLQVLGDAYEEASAGQIASCVL